MKYQASIQKIDELEIDFIEVQLAPHQQRLVKSLQNLVTHVLTTDEETEFFEGSAELMKLMANVVKQANFPNHLKSKTKIPYAEQALEYSLDNLSDEIQGNGKWMKIDN